VISEDRFNIFDLPRMEEIPADLITVEEVRDVPGGVSISWSGLGMTFRLVADPFLRSVWIELGRERESVRIYREGATRLRVHEESGNIEIVIEFSSGSQIGNIRVVLGDRVEVDESALFV
jgi:hypothetical protein